MAGIECGKFTIQDDESDGSGVVTFAGELAAATTTIWRETFFEKIAVDRYAVGSYAGDNLRLDGRRITFRASGLTAQAAVDVIRRAIDYANIQAPRREADHARAREEEQRRQQAAKDDLKKLKEKFQGGL